MYKKTDTILDKICENKLNEVKKREVKYGDKIKKLFSNNDRKKRNFAKALKKNNGISLIAEIKRLSPSNIGKVFRKHFDLVKIVKMYEKNGASAVSIITDEKFFMGRLNYIHYAKLNSNIPILQKDFIISEFQIYEAKMLGADAVLLIARILEIDRLKKLYNLASSLFLDCLIEVHNEDELKKVLKINPKIIGINNRDLKNMEVDNRNFCKLVELIPNNIIKVAESGIETNRDILEMKNAGADAVLIGSALMKASDIGEKIRSLLL